eukprot:SAG31_NODE_955_length_10799_cov_6.576636_11_plen_37_part_00
MRRTSTDGTHSVNFRQRYVEIQVEGDDDTGYQNGEY